VNFIFRCRLKADLFSQAYGVSINILVQMFHAGGSRVQFGLLDGGWVDVTALHLSSFTCVMFLTLSCYCFPCIFYHFIVTRLRPLL